MTKNSTKTVFCMLVTLSLVAGARADWWEEPAWHHSGLKSQDKPIWDNELAGWIRDYFPKRYSNMTIMMGQCYGGGFINDLKDFNNIVIGTAADWNEEIFFWITPPPDPGDSYGKRWTYFVEHNDPGDTMKNAHDAGATFPDPLKPHPQYYSNPGALGNTLKLKNAGEQSWHAILYVGTWDDYFEKKQFQSRTEKMFTILVRDYGYFPPNIDILFGDDHGVLNTEGAVTKNATRENLRKTFETTGKQLNSQEHFFFWVYDHGIPEPATLSLLALGGLVVMRRRRRR